MAGYIRNANTASSFSTAIENPPGPYPRDRYYAFEKLAGGQQLVNGGAASSSTFIGNAGITKSCLTYWDTGVYETDVPLPCTVYVWPSEEELKRAAHQLVIGYGTAFNVKNPPQKECFGWVDRTTVSPIIRCASFESMLRVFWYLTGVDINVGTSSWARFDEKNNEWHTDSQGFSIYLTVGINGRFCRGIYHDTPDNGQFYVRFSTEYPAQNWFDNQSFASPWFERRWRFQENVRVTFVNLPMGGGGSSYFTSYDPYLKYITSRTFYWRKGYYSGIFEDGEPPDNDQPNANQQQLAAGTGNMSIAGVVKISGTDVYYILGSPFPFGMPLSPDPNSDLLGLRYMPTLGWKTFESTFMENGPNNDWTYPQDFIYDDGEYLHEKRLMTVNVGGGVGGISVVFNVVWRIKKDAPEVDPFNDITVTFTYDGFNDGVWA